MLISVSVILTSLLVANSATQSLRRRHPLADLCLATVLVAGCLCTTLTALCLILLRRISLDSFSVAVIGLLPAAQVAPNLRLREIIAYIRMQRHRTLRLSPENFRYVRHGRPARDNQLADGGKCHASTYIRRPNCAMSLKDDLGFVWHGLVIQYDDKAMHLLDMNNQSESFRWWKSILKARHFIADPEKALLDSVQSAISAMRLAIDIVAIGDFVLQMHGDSLRQTFRNSSECRSARKSGFATVCNSIFRELGIAEDWGKIDESLEMFADDRCLLSRGRSYAAVFFILAQGSILKAREPGLVDWFAW